MNYYEIKRVLWQGGECMRMLHAAVGVDFNLHAAFSPTPFTVVDSFPYDSSSFGLQGDTDVICVLTEEFVCW